MTKHNHPDPADLPPESQESPATESEAAPAADTATEIARLKDQVLRALAESENIRRRMQKEIDDTRKYAVANFAKEMLPVADNFRRALDAIPKESESSETLKHLVTGVEATERQLLANLDRFGIRKIEPLGHPFDPNLHRVMLEIDDPAQPAGTVTQILQDGYMIHDRLLREALVAITKNGPTAHKVDQSA